MRTLRPMLDRSSGPGADAAAPLLTTDWTRFLYCNALLHARPPHDDASCAAARAPVIPAALAALGAWIRSARRGLARAREARATRRALQDLDDRSLHDLGLTRGEIGSVAAEATGQAPCTRMRVLHDLPHCDAAAAHALLASWAR